MGTNAKKLTNTKKAGVAVGGEGGAVVDSSGEGGTARGLAVGGTYETGWSALLHLTALATAPSKGKSIIENTKKCTDKNTQSKCACAKILLSNRKYSNDVRSQSDHIQCKEYAK